VLARIGRMSTPRDIVHSRGILTDASRGKISLALFKERRLCSKGQNKKKCQNSLPCRGLTNSFPCGGICRETWANFQRAPRQLQRNVSICWPYLPVITSSIFFAGQSISPTVLFDVLHCGGATERVDFAFCCFMTTSCVCSRLSDFATASCSRPKRMAQCIMSNRVGQVKN